MGKVKQQQSNPSGSSSGDDGNALAGSTLEDYFATHKGSGHVSQHLLNIPAVNDVMAAEKVGTDGTDWVLAKAGTKSSERKSEQENYKDDYESETSTANEVAPSEVAGLSLSDYLHVKEDDTTEAQEKSPRAGSQRTLPPQLAAASKKTAPTDDVSGMSLDHYLGASEQKSEENGHAARADKKPPPHVKRKGSKSKHSSATLPQAKATQQPFSVKGSGLIHGPPVDTNSQNVSSDEEIDSLTPFQRRQKRKDKAKTKQQRNAEGGGAPVSKAILMSDATSPPSTFLPVRDRDKRKSSMNASGHAHHSGHHGPVSNFQPPLPKLGVSPSVRSLSHKEHDAEDNGHDTAERLPPL